MKRHDCPEHREDIGRIISDPLCWEKLSGRTVAITGATGMIGCLLADSIMAMNDEGLDCHVLAMGRNEAKARERFPYFDSPAFSFECLDLATGVPSRSADYVVHLASTTHPSAYIADPVGTIRVNVNGLDKLLGYSVACGARLLFASSVEVYGKNRGDTERFTEDYCGYIDCQDIRSCYNESKRLGESLCQAYRFQEKADVVIARIARSYGPTLLPSDTRALSQFFHNALEGKDIVLKSDGTQRFSYLYSADVVSGLLRILSLGENGEAYNLADEESDIVLKDLAQLIADMASVRTVFQIPDKDEAAGFSKATLAIMDATKARHLGWQAYNNIGTGVGKTLGVFKKLSWHTQV